MNNEREFTGIDIPNTVTDPEEREFVELLNRITALAIKKEWSVMLLACSEGGKKEISVFEGCAHCISLLLKKTLDKSAGLLQILMMAIIPHLKDKQSAEGNLIGIAKKNTPAGN